MATPAKATVPKAAGLTVEQYAKATGLPGEFLAGIGVDEVNRNKIQVVAMRYRNLEAVEMGARFRSAMNGPHSVTWSKGSEPGLYGVWRIPEYRKKGFLFLVRGETDAQTIWFHGLPALGIPDEWREEWAPLLVGFGQICILIGSDEPSVPHWLAKSETRRRVTLVHLKSRDISELHLANPSKFKKALMAAVKQGQLWSQYEEEQKKKAADELFKACKEIACSADVLNEFNKALVKTGVTGEERNASLLYLAVTSRLLDKPVSVGVKGPSSVGKSYLVEGTLEFFPGSAYYKITGMSERALAYSEEPLEHRLIVLAEAAGISGEFQSYLIRSLLSEGRLVYETVEKGDDGKMGVRRIERAGPTGLLVTTTAVKLHAENETRFFSIRINDSAEQTAQIMAAEARRVSGTGQSALTADDLEKWRAYQEWLATTAGPVIVPFAGALAELVPPVAVRLRRDFNAVLSLIQTHAKLHIKNRKIEDGKIIATLEDYRRVRGIVRGILIEGVELGVSRTLRETVAAVASIPSTLRQPGVSVLTIAKKLKVDRSTAYRKIKECMDRELLHAVGEVKKGKPLLVNLGEPLSENEEVLPTAEEVAKQMKK
jgi:hypothetical protein